ncbi:hypothetical protein D9Q98_007860 [Chlorella vulgaris]|uniref:G-patch domain-containing protein n=1 Tax=Chlorella vulgaris TaxID=3077 RepID=A0A9D4THP6_CHLVU|nr:hypothetical protein D9Q98_007860 [Chlorella vulgaris]
MGKSGRHKKGKQGHQQAASKLSGSGRRTPRAPPPDFDAQNDSDEGGGTLHIGGMVIRVDGSGGGGGIRTATQSTARRRRRGSAGGPQRGSDFGNDSSSNGDDIDLDERAQAIQEYLADLEREGEGDAADGGAGMQQQQQQQQQRQGHNSDSSGSHADVEGASVSSGGGGSAAKRRRRQYQQYSSAVLMHRFCAFDMLDEGPVADLGWPRHGEEQPTTTDSEESSSEGSSSEESSSSSSDENSSDSGSSCEEDDNDDDELTQEELSKLSLAQRFPVTTRPRPPPLPGQQQQAKQAGGGSGKYKKKHRPGVKGAKGGKLAPGEKKRLKHEKRQAKRAARAAARGFDLTLINSQLEEFVLRQGDTEAFGPFGKHEGKAVARLAALYGCRATQQGSKTHRKLVMVSSTQHTCLPQGDQLLQVGQILAAQSAAERSGAAQDGRLAAAVAGQDLGSILPASLTGTRTRSGRWAEMQRSGGMKHRDNRDAARNRSSRNFNKPSRGMLKPVAFVSVGAINPDTAVEVAAPAAAAAAATAAAAAAAAECSSGSESDERAVTGLSSGVPGLEQQRAAMAAAAGFQLLEVVEDLSGSDLEGPEMVQEQPAMRGGASHQECGDEEEEEEQEEGQHGGLGSSGALYTRMTALSLAAPRAGASGASPSSSARGRAAAEGITNSGRLLGLGLALGIGPEVFGAPGPREAGVGGARWAAADTVADLSPLSPLLSKSQLRKLQRRASRGDGSPSALHAGLADAASQPWERLDGRKGKAGRSKQERRSRGGDGGNAAGEMEQPVGGLGLAAAAGQSGLVAGDFGYFERHTTGIGSKLLSKWGFGGEGGGLGRQQQGRAEPVVAVRRAKKLGLGAID